MAATASLGDFNENDKNSWFFGELTREETNEILRKERDSGVFLVRASNTIRGDFVLCVKEDNKVSHYIINTIQSNGTTRYRIGEQEFPDLQSLLVFYKVHYLDSTPLIRPAPRAKVVAKFDFGGRDPEDLPFKKGEVLTVITKDEEQWWTAMDSAGRKGQIPVNYVEPVQAESDAKPDALPPPYEESIASPPANIHPFSQQRKLPAPARVIQNRVPSAYDKTALQLTIDEIVLVTACHLNGQWEGELNGKKGFFPFTHVRFLDQEEEEGGGDSLLDS